MVLVELGYAAEQAGDPAAALALHLEAFEVAQAMGAPRDAIGALEGMASAAPTRRSRPGCWAPRPPPGSATDSAAAPAERDELDRITARLVAALGRERFDALVAEGTHLSPGEARALLRSAGRLPADFGR